MQMIMVVAAGGAIGAVLRHGMNNVMTHILGTGFPWGIFMINILGSFAMGILISVLAHFWSPPQEMRAFLAVGLLGSFTTFSTFSLDAVTLIERHAYIPAALYIGGSVVLAIGGLFAGMLLVRGFVS